MKEQRVTNDLIKIGIFFGGPSREREISFAGGRTVYDNLNKSLFQPVPVFVDSYRNFILLDWAYVYKGTIRDFYPPVEALPPSPHAFQVYLESLGELSDAELDALIARVGRRVEMSELPQLMDLAFLALHGEYGEDGQLQGLLESLKIPYTGSGLRACSIGIDKAFQKTINSLETLQETAPYRDEHYLRNEYLLQLEKYTFQEGKKRTTEMNLQEVSDALDTTFLADKLRQSCLMLFHQAVYKADYRIGMLEEVLQYLERNQMLDSPAISVYYYIYKSITEKEAQPFFVRLRSEIELKGHLFPHHEIRDIYLMTINYCIRKMNTGEASYVREAFELYRTGIEEGILIESGIISRSSSR